MTLERQRREAYIESIRLLEEEFGKLSRDALDDLVNRLSILNTDLRELATFITTCHVKKKILNGFEANLTIAGMRSHAPEVKKEIEAPHIERTLKGIEECMKALKKPVNAIANTNEPGVVHEGADRYQPDDIKLTEQNEERKELSWEF